MTTFKLGQPVITKEPFVTVDNKFKPGTYRFRLIVRRADGTESQPVFQDITILPEGVRNNLGSRLLVEPQTKAEKPKKTRKRPRRGQGTRGSHKPEP